MTKLIFLLLFQHDLIGYNKMKMASKKIKSNKNKNKQTNKQSKTQKQQITIGTMIRGQALLYIHVSINTMCLDIIK